MEIHASQPRTTQCVSTVRSLPFSLSFLLCTDSVVAKFNAGYGYDKYSIVDCYCCEGDNITECVE